MATLLMRLPAERLRGSSSRQFEFGTNDAIGRVCARLLYMADRYGQTRPDGTVTLRTPVTQNDLAALKTAARPRSDDGGAPLGFIAVA